MQINSISPLCVKNFKWSSKPDAVSFGQETSSDSEKLTKSLEALSDIGSANMRISAKRETFELDKRIISAATNVKGIIENTKYRYITGQKILKHANNVIERFTDESELGRRRNIDGYPYSANRRNDCLYIDSLYKGEEFYEEDSFPAPPELHVVYKEKDDETGIKYTAKSKIGADKYEVFPYEEDGSFNMKRTLPDNTFETYSFYNNGKFFEYKKYDARKKEEVTSLSVLENNTIEYKDKKKEPEGITLRVNPDEECVYVKNNNGEEKVFVDDGIINNLLNSISFIDKK